MTNEKFSEDNLDPAEIRRIWKNVAVVAVSFMVHFTAINAAINLQSSINAEEGLGTASLVALFTGNLVSNIFLTSVVIRWLGTKRTIYCGFITYMPYIVSQMYPRFYTLVPAALFLGLGSGPLWCAESTYLSVASEAHSLISKIPAKRLLSRFLGFFFMIMQSSQIWGNLISSLVISTANNASMTIVSESNIPLLCGSNFLPNLDASAALPPQPPKKINILAGTYLACMVAATIIVVKWLDPMKRYAFCRKKTDNSLAGLSLLTATVKQLANISQLLLVPISIFSGLHQSFFFADFTSSFVSCAIGTGSVGYVMMAYGASDVMGCLVTGFLVKSLGRLPVICGALFIHGGLFVTLLSWRPNAGDYYVMFIIAVFWGVCNSVWMVQIYTYHGVLFRGKEEAAYSNYQQWMGTGYVIAAALSSYVRTRYKVYLIFSVLITGGLGYLTVEYRQRRIALYSSANTSPDPDQGE
ncbi:unnamed protein product [Arctia plantaginis]|uniref:UNC93-like protein n=1 Tax=Arctia plantaginis TaxID=874455 RepID=A0A8S0Z3S6_ARCPL|nr:unnamed protein product [Arctia plantaginis]